MVGRGASISFIGAATSSTPKGVHSYTHNLLNVASSKYLAVSSSASWVGTATLTVPKGTHSSFGVIGRAANVIEKKLPMVGWDPVSYYNPVTAYGTTNEGRLNQYWQRDLQSSGSAVTFTISLSRQAAGGETVSWAADGDALTGTHWSTITASTFTLTKGQSSIDVEITPIESGKWYRERTVKLQLSGEKVLVDGERGFIHLVFNSSVLPPVLTLTGPGTHSAGSPFSLTVTALSAAQDPVVLWAEVDAATTAGGAAIIGNGSVVIAAGATTGQFLVTTSSAGDLIVNLTYERGGTLFTQLDYNPDTSTFNVSRNVHLDENLWRRSNDINLLRYDVPDTDPVRPVTSGHPASHIGGGAASKREGLGEAESIAQDAVPALVDPVTGNDLRLFHPSPNLKSGMSYLRESFEITWGGGAGTSHDIHPYSMVRFYFTEMVGVDADRNVEFIHLRIRIRSHDRNHGITFRFSYELDSGDTAWKKHQDGSSVGNDFFEFPSGLVVWPYSKFNGHEDSDDGWGIFYGADVDEYGTYLWFQHRCHSSTDYSSHSGDTGGAANDEGWWFISQGKLVDGEYKERNTVEVAADPTKTQATGNPIEYPIWTIANDGTNTEPGNSLNEIRNGRKGTLMHGMQFTMAEALIDPPVQFWPCEKSRWDPRGLAIIADSGTAHIHTVTIT